MFEFAISSRRRRIFAFIADHTIMCFLAAAGCLLAMGKHWDLAGPDRMLGFPTGSIQVQNQYDYAQIQNQGPRY